MLLRTFTHRTHGHGPSGEPGLGTWPAVAALGFAWIVAAARLAVVARRGESLGRDAILAALAVVVLPFLVVQFLAWMRRTEAWFSFPSDRATSSRHLRLVPRVGTGPSRMSLPTHPREPKHRR